MKALLSVILVLGLLVACDTATDAYLPDMELATLSFEVGCTGEEIGEVNAVTPSTNALNKAMEPVSWAYAQLEDARVGSLDINFVSRRAFASCFEYRVDDAEGTGTNYNTDITDGLYPFFCVNDSNRVETITADSTIDIRMVFGAERDERFDWTRFYVMTEQTKNDCRDGGWQNLGFKNQGQCIASFVANENSPH